MAGEKRSFDLTCGVCKFVRLGFLEEVSPHPKAKIEDEWRHQSCPKCGSKAYIGVPSPVKAPVKENAELVAAKGS